MKSFKQFLKQEIIFTSAIALIAFILFKTVFSNLYLPIFWIMLLVIATLTALVHYSILRSSNKESTGFTAKFMAFSGAKMMIYLAFITIYAFMFPEKAKAFLISFFILYLLYSSFGVVLIVKQIKNRH
ncbi:MAG: hypothetical protein MI739_01810 [Bacteroidales bacterium]|nr:hypothetical protein [Bacteroidales bacterium]